MAQESWFRSKHSTAHELEHPANHVPVCRCVRLGAVQFSGIETTANEWADAANAPAHLHSVLVSASRTGAARDDITVQRDRAVPRQRPAFQIHPGGNGD